MAGRTDRHGDVLVFRMDAGENRFDPTMIAAWNEALDEAEKGGSPCALVTVGTGRFYSNGLDLDFMMSGEMTPNEYLREVLAIYGRVLSAPFPTVAAMNGHAFGAGGQVALAHDFRVMRSDRGYFCMPEVDMKAPLHPGMTAILKARLPEQTAHEVIATGRRFGGDDALAAGIVDEVAPDAEVLERAIARAAPLAAKADPAMSRLKSDLYPEVLAALRAELEEIGG